MSFKFGNDIFIIFEMPRSSYQRLIDKNNISLLFRPSVIRGPWLYNMPRYKEKAKICWVESENADRSSNTFIMSLKDAQNVPKLNSQTKITLYGLDGSLT